MLTGSWPRDDLTNLNSRSMLEPYTSGSIGAAKNDNSGLAGLEIYLGASKGRRSRHRTLYPVTIHIAESRNYSGLLGLMVLVGV